ncbi:tRNA (adenosine(37)-N6)-threonylcarbamoyltransferase complex dimerization subunit type 1 TsaB [Agromyces seonyuensis]|uniref:tRNA (Adenosine(37)-N6)-threonylcarbamoyltransferase complex dimerization subunit type 1 TsaB n=1 Tax=Agromyces seonyuensis TaxID=2662446 RepID=A0A6I4P0N3_9MICO|nr:tRNA (adenosine(37)-N6)-threonylcarbamoyltransferase complex dimerization subunit type 1 TsaB [Agromyces seonyuensis]MWC00097.1 tRNA (adenosine(37)-N6)-threonylcarbamoyltransferase complex dimerization subunit type 1 TsaB [Agromyces seonyuensis]
MLLAIDTSLGTSVAVVDFDGGVLAEVGTADTMRHAEVVGTAIAEALETAGVAPGDLSGVAAGMGPGPFTGLRVGIAAAHAFALGIGRPVVPVVSHDAVASAWYRDGGSGALRVLTDARRREFAWSVYEGVDDAGLPIRVEGPGLVLRTELPDFAGTSFEAAEVPAGALGLVAERAYAAGRDFPADEPLYLRSPDVTMSAGPKRVSS